MGSDRVLLHLPAPRRRGPGERGRGKGRGGPHRNRVGRVPGAGTGPGAEKRAQRVPVPARSRVPPGHRYRPAVPVSPTTGTAGSPVLPGRTGTARATGTARSPRRYKYAPGDRYRAAPLSARTAPGGTGLPPHRMRSPVGYGVTQSYPTGRRRDELARPRTRSPAPTRRGCATTRIALSLIARGSHPDRRVKAKRQAEWGQTARSTRGRLSVGGGVPGRRAAALGQAVWPGWERGPGR